MITTSDIAKHDLCERFQTWSSQFELPRIPLSDALNSSLREGLLSGDAGKANAAFIAQASSPGLDIEGRNVYDIAVHHATMLEVICAYLLGDNGAWKPAGAVDDFQPMSFQMDDGRLRRVVLCSTWSTLREFEERISWWTMADTCMTGRPQLVNVIVIGQSRSGFRSSPWTTGFIHPENGIMRIRKKDGKFMDNWRRVYREATDYHPSEWLDLMQKDGAFEDVVFHWTAEVPKHRESILRDMERIKTAIGGTEMRRSACYRFAPCPMAGLCHRGITPEQALWKRKMS